MSTAKSIIILTSGLSGSSVLAGLLARAGYWTGTRTFRKDDYETFENCQLIRLNRRLFAEAGYDGDYTKEVSRPAVSAIAALHDRIDCRPFRAMVEECEQHRPWLWKDPRLWLTIRFWTKLLDLEECRFIHFTRGLGPLWISSLLRRQIMSYQYLKNYEAQVNQIITGYLEENRIASLRMSYEALITEPGKAIERLNRYLDTRLAVADLEEIYAGPLYRNPRASWASVAKAMLVYARNYSERLDVVRK